MSFFVAIGGQDMSNSHYMISDAAKKVEVETHVLRYWEEELNLTIKRNEMGHRYYTKEDIERFIKIKTLKEQGFQLKAIRLILVNGNINRIDDDGKIVTNSRIILDTISQSEEPLEPSEKENVKLDVIEKEDMVSPDRSEKNYRAQMLLKKLISDVVKENNGELCDEIKNSVIKELDYQFRQQEEKEEERETNRVQREEEYYKRLDELVCNKARKKVVEPKPKREKYKLRKMK